MLFAFLMDKYITRINLPQRFLFITFIVSVNGHYYMNLHEFSVNRNIKVQRNLIVGEREHYDGEIVTYDADEEKRRFFFSTHTFKFYLRGSKITCIFITNMLSYKVPFYVTLIGGGVGKSFIILKFKSGWQSAMLARITLYGYAGRYAISGPTQAPLTRTRAEIIDPEDFEHQKDIPLIDKLWVAQRHYGDRLVYVSRTTKTGRWFGRESTVLTYNDSKVRITSFSFKMMLDYPKCFLNCIAGGVNTNNLSVEVKSAFNKGFCVQMEIFGRTVKQRRNTSSPTKNYIIYRYRLNKRVYKNFKIIP